MPRKRINVEKIREILRLHLDLKFSIREVAKSVGVSKTSVGEYVAEVKRSALTYDDITKMRDSVLIDLFEKNNREANPLYEDLSKDFLYIEKELKRPGVTLYLLWEEYTQRKQDGFSYSRFCHHYRMWKSKQNPGMHMDHKAGDKVYVDFTGKKMHYVEPDTGQIHEAEIFVATLGASQLTYVEAVNSQRLEDWIRANDNALRFFGGAPRGIAPDNLKSAVTVACNYEPLLNQTYDDFARHYNTVILPTRPIKPQDKSLAEIAVNLTYQRIFAPLRNITFFSLEEMNQAIWDELEKLNNTRFQKREISRRQLFEEIEKSELRYLPAERYEIKNYQSSRVEFNYHVYLKEDRHYYSVPYQYTGQPIKIIYTSRVVEVYRNNERIAMHLRNRTAYQYTTVKEHMPPNHQFINGWSPKRFIRWAASIGGQVETFIQLLLDSKSHPEQAFKACMGVMRLGKKYDKEALQLACKKAVEFNIISYRFIDNSLKNKTYMMEDETDNSLKLPLHENIRGKENYK